MQSRRGFIRQSTVWAGACVLGAGRGAWLGALHSGIDPASIDRFRNKLSGRLILPSDADYDTARAVFWLNPETDKHPAIIARCKSEGDVLRCIDFAGEYE